MSPLNGTKNQGDDGPIEQPEVDKGVRRRWSFLVKAEETQEKILSAQPEEEEAVAGSSTNGRGSEEISWTYRGGITAPRDEKKKKEIGKTADKCTGDQLNC